MEEKITFNPGSFFHGTKADLKTGDFLTKGFVSNYADRTAKYVYSREQDCREGQIPRCSATLQV